jgi:predicted outer membrane repeat protein
MMVGKLAHSVILVLMMAVLMGCNAATGAPATVTEQPVGPASSATPSALVVPATASPTSIPTAQATSTPAFTATPAASAGAVVVDTLDQEVYPFVANGNCSLGEAIQTIVTQQAQDKCALPAGSSTIYLPSGTYTLTQSDNAPAVLFGHMQRTSREGLPPAGFPLITSKLTILGNGSTIQRSGPTKFGIFQVFVGGNLTLQDLTISGGDTSADHNSSGAAVSVLGGSVLLDHVTLTGNQAFQGGAIANNVPGAEVKLMSSVVSNNSSLDNGGGIYNSGTLVIQDSQISNNSSRNTVFGGGGIYNDNGQVTLDHSQLVGNLALEGGGLYNDGGSVNIINQSVISGNVATEQKAFIPHGGGGINNISSGAVVTIDQSFVIGNQAAGTTGGGIYNQASLKVTGSVLAGNIAGSGGAIFNDSDGSGSVGSSCILNNQVLLAHTAGLGNGIANANSAAFAASQNWWGTPGGPGNSVSPGVTATPSLSAAAGLCASAPPTPFPTPPGP